MNFTENTSYERKLASIRRIDAIEPIPDADAIEVATVGGWKVVVKRGEYQEGDFAIYCEIDSWIPHTLAPFLTPEGQFPKVYKGIEGQRLKTRRMRGQISQGLLLPLETPTVMTWHEEAFLWKNLMGHYVQFIMGFANGENEEGGLYKGYRVYDFQGRDDAIVEGQDILIGEEPILNITFKVGDQFIEDADLTAILSITKWEPEIVSKTGGVAAGSFPTHLVPKTDAERIQNLSRKFCSWAEDGEEFYVTEKMDGTSFTAVTDGIEVFVCSRNLKLKDEGDNLYWKVAHENRIPEFLLAQGLKNQLYSIQGEIVGPGIQGNKYGLSKPTLFVFSIFDVREQRFLTQVELLSIVNEQAWNAVPVIKVEGQDCVTLGQTVGFRTVPEVVTTAEAKSVINPKTDREGIVLWHKQGQVKFKAISNSWLMKHQ